MTDVSALEALLAERECAGLVRRYAELADGHDPDAFAQLFTSDGSWGRGEAGAICGHEEIRRAYAGRERLAGSRHLVLDVAVKLLDSGTAEVHSSAFVLKPAGQPGRLDRFLVAYRDSMARGADGVWRISQRQTTLLMREVGAAG